MERFFLSLLAVSCVSLVTSQVTWSQVTAGGGTAPAGRRNAVAGFHAASNSLVLFGGRSSNSLNETWIFNLTTSRWRQVLTTVQPAPRFSLIGAVSGNNFYIATGEGVLDGKRTFFNDIWSFSMITETWSELPAKAQPSALSSVTQSDVVRPETRYGSAGGVLPGEDRFYVALGFDATRYSNVFSYHLDDQYWEEEYPNRPPYGPGYPHARCLHSGTMIDTTDFVIFGGCLTGGKTGGACPAGDSWRFDGRRRSWKRLMSCAEPRIYSSMAMLPPSQGKRRVVLYGGNPGGSQVITTDAWPKDEIAVFDPDTDDWSLKKVAGSSFPDRRHGAAMVTSTNGLYVIGGSSMEGNGLLSDVWLLSGTAADTDALATSRSCGPVFFNYLMLHGIFMVVGWGVLLQLGAFIARYFRHKDPLWFKLHRGLQIAGLCVALLGFIFAFLSVQFDHMQFSHAVLGVIIMLLGISQPINAAIRPHKEKDQPKSRKRWIWEKVHHALGRVGLILALANISIGVFLAQASRPVYAVWFTYLALLIVAYIIAEGHRHWSCIRKCFTPEIANQDSRTISPAKHTSNLEEPADSVPMKKTKATKADD